MKIDPTKTWMSEALKHSAPLISCRCDPSGQYVFAGAQQSGLVRWNLADKQLTSLTGTHDSWVRAMAFDAARNHVISGGYDGRLVWWPVADKQPEPLRTVDAHAGWIKALAVSPDGQTLASCGNDKMVRLWSLADGSPQGELAGHEQHVYQVAFHPQGQHLASLDLKGLVRHWELSSGKLLRELKVPELHKYDTTFGADIGGARGLEFRPDGQRLFCGGISNVSNAFAGIGDPLVVAIDWEADDKRQLLAQKTKTRGSIWGLNWHADGFLIAAVGGSGGGFLLFFPPDQVNESFGFKLPNTAKDMHLHPDGQRVAVAHQDGNLRLYTLSAKPA